MNVYFSGIGGVGIGPLAEIAYDAGHSVRGSDNARGLMSESLQRRGIDISYDQSGKSLQQIHQSTPIEWFVYTSALADDHPELVFARENDIRLSKRDEFIAELLKLSGKKMIAIAGTHGKTTTTGLMIWALQKLSHPTSYSVGTTISFGPSGYFDNSSEYFVYECDEFDRNFLYFEPHISIITALDHDHVDTYPTLNDYRNAFVQFIEQSDMNYLWEKDLQFLAADVRADLEAYDEHMDLFRFTLAGLHVRQNAYLVYRAIKRLYPELQDTSIVTAINSFPGTARRFENLAENLYSDYGHYPREISATLQLAKEISDEVVLVYQPHQNVRQHQIKDDYTDCMELADEIYWLPTYLSREDPELDVLAPQDLTKNLTNEAVLHYAELDDELWINITRQRDAGRLVLVMGAGSIDGWVRDKLSEAAQ